METLDSPVVQIFLLEKYKFFLTEKGTLYKSMLRTGAGRAQKPHEHVIRYVAHGRDGIPAPEDAVIKVDSEIIQICQGRDHLLILDSSGKVYALGDNSHFQVCPVDTEDLIKAGATLISSIHPGMRSSSGVLVKGLVKAPSQAKVDTPVGTQQYSERGNRDEPPIQKDSARLLEPRGSGEQSQNLFKDVAQQAAATADKINASLMGVVENPPVIVTRVSVFIPEPLRVKFGGMTDTPFVRVHAFGNTSLAYDRLGRMHLWGENLVTQEHGLAFGEDQNIRTPTVVRNFGLNKLTPNPNQVILDRLPADGSGRDMLEDKTLTLLKNYKGMSEIDLARLKPMMEMLAFKIHQNSELGSNKGDTISSLSRKIDALDEQYEINKTDTRRREEIKKEIKDLKERRANLETEKKKVDNDLKDAQNRLAQGKKDDKTSQEKVKILDSLIAIHRQTKREKEASTAIKSTKLLLDSMVRRFQELDQAQVFRRIQTDSVAARIAFYQVHTGIEEERILATEDLIKLLADQKSDLQTPKYVEMYKTGLNVLSMVNRLQFAHVVEAEQMVVGADPVLLEEQQDSTISKVEDSRKPTFRNLEHLAHKIFNFKFTNKQ